jgi:amino acid transporter
MITLVCVLMVIALGLIVLVASQPPGVSEPLYNFNNYFPLGYAYANMFGTTYNQTLFLCVIPLFGTCWAMMYVITKQIYSMTASGLLPEVLNKTYKFEFFRWVGGGDEPLPLVSYALICFVGWLIHFFVRYANRYVAHSQVATVAGCFVYMAMFYCYVVFRYQYSHMERTFRNPCGVISVIIGVIIFFVMLVYVLLVDPSHNRAVTILFFSYIGLMIIYYLAHAQTNQKFSESEQSVFFKAYIMKSTPTFLHLPCFFLYVDLCWFSFSSHSSFSFFFLAFLFLSQ